MVCAASMLHSNLLKQPGGGISSTPFALDFEETTSSLDTSESTSDEHMGLT